MMFHGKVSGAVKKFVGFSGKHSLESVYPVDVFHFLLHRERARTDRTGETFSVIAFAPCDEDSAPPPWQRLVKILQRRLRSTDDVGWLDDRQLGVLLPFTESSGAWTVVDSVRLLFSEDMPWPHCTVYTYPGLAADGDGPGAAGEAEDLARPINALETLFLQPMPVWKRLLDILGTGLAL